MKNSTKQFGQLGFTTIAVAITMLASALAHASTSATAYYELGEADTSAASNTPPLPGDGGGTVTVDSSGHGFNLTESGSPTYSSNVPTGIGSTLSVAFTPADSYSRPTPVTTATTNVLLEAWVYPTTYNTSYVVHNGSYGFYEQSGAPGTAIWSFIEDGMDFNYAYFNPIVANTWYHLGLLLDSSGNLTGYIDGVPVVTQAVKKAITPSGEFFIGGGFEGNVDDVEVYTPEPASLGLLTIGGLALLRRRR